MKEKDLQEQVQKHIGIIIHEFILANIKLIGVVALISVAVAASIIGWLSYRKSMNEKALVLESEAIELYDTVSSGATTDDSETPQKTFQDVLALYQKIMEEYPGTDSAKRALYWSGSLEYNLGNYEKAYEHFKTYIKEYPKEDLCFQAEKDIGYIFEQQGEYQKAIEQFKSIEQKVPSSMKSQLLLDIGRNYESLEQFDNAVEIYQNIIDSNTGVSWKDKARERVDILRPGSSLLEETTQEEVTQEETTQEQATQEETTQEEVSPEETPQEEATQEEATPDSPKEESN